jgi:hypothetical protein
MEAFRELGDDDENTVGLPDLKLAQSGEPVAKASSFGNIPVSTCPPPAPLAFFNNVAGPLQARLPWGEQVVSRRHGGPPPSHLPFSNQEPQQQQHMQSFMQGMQQQELYNRARSPLFSQGIPQHQPRPAAPKPPPAAAPSVDYESIMRGSQQQQLHNRASNTTFPQGVQQQQQQQQPPPVLMPSKACVDTRRQQSFPVPTGMEVVLPDHNGVERRYKVQYNMYSMKREDAMQYMERLATAGQGSANEQDHAMQEGGETPSNAKKSSETPR